MFTTAFIAIMLKGHPWSIPPFNLNSLSAGLPNQICSVWLHGATYVNMAANTHGGRPMCCKMSPVEALEESDRRLWLHRSLDQQYTHLGDKSPVRLQLRRKEVQHHDWHVRPTWLSCHVLLRSSALRRPQMRYNMVQWAQHGNRQKICGMFRRVLPFRD